jgi:hypothetical protein
MQLIINPAGNLRGIYGEEFDLHVLGSVEIRRASQVEPDEFGSWWADLSPVGGPKLGPFLCRSQAIVAELQWLHDHWMIS